MKEAKPGQEKAEDQVHHVRITLSSKNLKNLEQVCAELINGAKNKRRRVEADEGTPTRIMPVAISSPCGDGLYNSQLQNRRQSKKGITNFRWSPSMSCFLLPFLVNLVKQGHRVNRTFRRQSFEEAARAVNEKFNVRCTASNVENHMRTVKTRYQQIKKLQGLDTTTWDEKERTIIMDAKAYGDHISAYPRDEPFLNKKIDQYDDMVILCSDDHTTDFALIECSTVDVSKENVECAAVRVSKENVEVLPKTAGGDVNIVMDEDVEIEEAAEEEAQSRSQQVSMPSGSTDRAAEDGRENHNLGDKIEYLALQIGELVESIRSSCRGISSELFSEIMKCKGYDELSLGRAFDYLHEHENLGRAFLAKNQNLRRAWLSDFFSYSDPKS